MEPLPKPERNNGSEIDLSNVEVSYWSDEEIASFFDARLKALEDPTGFIEANRWQLDNFRRHRTEEGYSDQEMIDLFIQREKQMSVKAKEKAIAIKKELEGKEELILDKVKERLAKYLPDWQAGKVKVTFKIMESADYRHPDGGRVDADLWRLSFKNDPIGDIIQGVTHELFHEWMNETGFLEKAGKGGSAISPEDGKMSVRAETIDEGLAVFVAEQSLRVHYEEGGRNYETSVAEAFQYFRDICTLDNLEKILSMGVQGFKNMGQFYVVGYEVAKAVFDTVGIERFREIVASIRENPEMLYEEYKRVYLERKDLPVLE